MVQLDLQTKKTSMLLGSVGLWAPRWSPNGRSIAAFTVDDSKLMLLDINTGHIWYRSPCRVSPFR